MLIKTWHTASNLQISMMHPGLLCKILVQDINYVHLLNNDGTFNN